MVRVSTVRWWEVEVRVPANMADDAAALAIAGGAAGAEVEVTAIADGESTLRIAFPEELPVAEVTRVVQNALANLGLERAVAVHDRIETDWSERWKEHFEPLCIGDRLWVVPSWHPDFVAPRDARVLRLDPGMAFGTGQHETTALCAEWLEAHVSEASGGPSVLDVGCGSGILSLAAAQWGARRVVGIDNDPVAVRVARENAAANGAKVELSERSLADLSDTFDVVVANILAETLCRLAGELVRHTVPGGWLVLSGILVEQSEDVEERFRAEAAAAGRTVSECTVEKRGIWVAVTMRL